MSWVPCSMPVSGKSRPCFSLKVSPSQTFPLLADKRLRNQSLQQFGCKADKISSQTKAAKIAKTAWKVKFMLFSYRRIHLKQLLFPHFHRQPINLLVTTISMGGQPSRKSSSLSHYCITWLIYSPMKILSHLRGGSVEVLPCYLQKGNTKMWRCFLYRRTIVGHLIFRHRISLLKFRHLQDMVSIAELVILSYFHFLYCQQRDENTSPWEYKMQLERVLDGISI